MYGVLPTLMLLEEYETKEMYEECELIQKAIRERIDRVNKLHKHIPDFDLPTHITQIDSFDDDYSFQDDEEFKRNVKNYIQAIKNLVNG